MAPKATPLCALLLFVVAGCIIVDVDAVGACLITPINY
jgi:hypothetical protein